MKLSLDLRTSLSQTLTPQQIQYLKLLQLPILQLEQQVFQELELNPMLDAAAEGEAVTSVSMDDSFDEFGDTAYPEPPHSDESVAVDYGDSGDDFNEDINYLKNQEDPFEFYNLLWQDESDSGSSRKGSQAFDDDFEPFQIKQNHTFTEDLLDQLRLLRLNEEEMILGGQLIGNLDNDGYLRRELEEIVFETNEVIDDINTDRRMQEYENGEMMFSDNFDNPARQFALSSKSNEIITKFHVKNGNGDIFADEDDIKYVSLETAEKLLKLIQTLDPPGIGSRNVQECLIAQCKAFSEPTPAQKLALEILTNQYDAFTKKHFHVITKQLDVTDDFLRDAMDVIRRLNPKPGGGDNQSEMNTVVPDFVIERDEDKDDLIITVNESRLPQLRLNTTYEKIRKEARLKVFNKETREWIKNKYEDAKFLIQAIRQRRSTMLKVMTAIAHFQKSFFFEGHSGLKPLIYKDISEATGLDISTVCRIVNGKYVQTDYGTFELKFYFSESLANDDGEDVSTTVIKQIIKEIIEEEDKSKPHSDDKISDILKEKGYNVARRTVAKYREQQRLPVARLRKEL
ncbi:MAG: polymerase sigma-54 factor [Ignavibacteria bacterium]|nr:polymerase sigma-54 factor [Ignavibacteria bacterium]